MARRRVKRRKTKKSSLSKYLRSSLKMKVKVNLKPKNTGGLRGVILLLGCAFGVYALFTRGSVPWLRPAQSPAPHYAVSQPAMPVARPARKPEAPALTPGRQVPILPVKPSPAKPKVTFVIDDMGYNQEDLSLLKQLGNQVTYAILPLLPHSRFFGELSQETGAEVILHLPLESENGTIPGHGLITDRMPPEHVLDVLRRNLASVPHHVGVNNHMGSRGTGNPELMQTILKELKKKRLFFLDSFTTADSVGVPLSRNMGLPVLKRDIFLDNIDEQEAVREEIRELASIARRNGSAIGIGHYRYNTLKVLGEEIPRLWDEGFEIVSLSRQIRSKKKF